MLRENQVAPEQDDEAEKQGREGEQMTETETREKDRGLHGDLVKNWRRWRNRGDIDEDEDEDEDAR